MKTKIAFIAQVVVALPFRIWCNDLRLRRGLGLFTLSHCILFVIFIALFAPR